MTPPVLTGKPHVGQTITAHVGAWAKEWHVNYFWRRTGRNIAGERGLAYRARAADAGKEISILAYGDYHYPDGVHPIDRYASRVADQLGHQGDPEGRLAGPRASSASPRSPTPRAPSSRRSAAASRSTTAAG